MAKNKWKWKIWFRGPWLSLESVSKISVVMFLCLVRGHTLVSFIALFELVQMQLANAVPSCRWGEMTLNWRCKHAFLQASLTFFVYQPDIFCISDVFLGTKWTHISKAAMGLPRSSSMLWRVLNRSLLGFFFALCMEILSITYIV